jgi:hypothetical protein
VPGQMRLFRPRLVVLTVVAVVLSGAASEEKPEAGEAAAEAALGEVVLPKPTPAQQAAPEALEGGSEESTEQLTAQALSRLKDLMESEGAKDVGALVELAKKRAKDSRKTVLLTAVLAAANSSEVPLTNSSAAAIELGHMCAVSRRKHYPTPSPLPPHQSKSTMPQVPDGRWRRT